MQLGYESNRASLIHLSLLLSVRAGKDCKCGILVRHCSSYIGAVLAWLVMSAC